MILAVAYPPSSYYPAIALEMSIPTCDLAPSFPLGFRLHLDLDSNKRTDGFAAHLSSSFFCFSWTSMEQVSMKCRCFYASCLHVHWQASHTHTQHLLSCVRAGVLGSGVGKGANTKQPTITTACQWSQQRLSMQSHKEGSKSQRFPVCLYSSTASQNPRQLRLSKIVDTIPSVML